jgi:SPP1 gp7 family putative phage head morphogenesis protein
VIAPLEQTLTHKLKMEQDMAKLISRKANQPYVITAGNDKYPNVSQDDINAIGNDLNRLTNMTEWVFPWTVNVSTVDFGQLGEKFAMPLDYMENQIIYGLEIPLVLLGQGNIPEGLALSQSDAWEKRIKSIRLSIEEPLEDQILRRIVPEKVEFDFQWEEVSEDDKWKEIKNITSLFSLQGLDPRIVPELNKRLIDLLDLDLEGVVMPEKPEENPEDKKDKPEPKKECAHCKISEAVKKSLAEKIAIAEKKPWLGIDAFLAALTRDERNAFFLDSNMTLDGYQERGIEEVEWIALGDDRMCELCNSHDGEKFNILQAREMIPAHINCRCRWKPVIG